MRSKGLGQAHWLAAGVSLIVLVGCAGLQDGALKPDAMTCEELDAATLTVAQDQLDRSTDSATLLCAVNTLRDTADMPLRRSALGSRLCLHLAERELDPARREQYAVEGVRFAETALTLGGGDDGAVHYYLAANLGLSVREHMTAAIGSLGRLEQEMKRAVALSPAIDDGGPLRLLGALYLKAPAWPAGIGDRDKALALLGEAVRRYPQHPINHLFYAQALWEEGDDASLAEAKTALAMGEKLLADGDWGYNLAPWQKEFAESSKEFGLANGPQQ